MYAEYELIGPKQFEGSTTTGLQLLTSSVQDQPSKSLYLSFLCEYRVILTKPLKDMGRDGCKLEPRTCFFESVVSGPQWSAWTAGMYCRSLGEMLRNFQVSRMFIFEHLGWWFRHIYIFLPQTFLEDLYSDPLFVSIGVETSSFYNIS